MAGQDVQVKIGAVDQTKAAFNSVSRSLSGLRSAVFSVQGAIAGIAGISIVKGFLDANVSFQKLEASLITFTGSAGAAAAQFKELQQFAATTPFQLEEVVGGFNKLVARGINPTIASFQAFGNIAAGTGKTLDQFVEAVADAAVGEFERLKEFGIKASVEGDKVRMTFGGVTETIAKDSTAILGYLEKLGQTKFAGAIERQAQTLGGAFSNLQDALTTFAVEIGKSGVTELLVDLTRGFTGLINKISKGLAGTNNPVKQAVKDIATLKEILAETSTGTKDYDNVLTELNKTIEKYASLTADGRKNAPFPGLQPAKVTIGKITEGIKQAKDITDQSIKTVDLYKSAWTKFEDKWNEKDEVGLYLSNQKDQVQSLVPVLADAGKEIREFGLTQMEVARRGIETLEDSLVGLINGSMSASEAFGKMAQSIINDLIRMSIQQSITRPLFDVFSGMFGGTQAPAPVYTAMPRAMGGSVTSGQPYMVGERGPELFVPGQTGTIVPNGQMGGAGTVINQTINVTTGVQQTVRAEIMTLMPQIAAATKAAVADAKMRGGSYAAALR